MSCLHLARALATLHLVSTITIKSSIRDSQGKSELDVIGRRTLLDVNLGIRPFCETISHGILTGSRRGADVVQVYIHDPVSALRRPQRELKGFEKVYLDSNQTENISLTLDKYAFSYWDDKAQCWVLEEGEFDVILGKIYGNTIIVQVTVMSYSPPQR
jgi:hypothetical protein